MAHGNCSMCGVYVAGSLDAVRHFCPPREAQRGVMIKEAWGSKLITERTPDGHPQVWLLYRPEPFDFDSDDERSIHLWVRRCEVFTSRAAAIAHLDNLLGRQIAWRPYHDLFPELWIAEDRGQRWLMAPAPVDPPGGQRG